MEEILNYIKINTLISTSGQPTIKQFELIKSQNFEVVINLALSNASNALENEDKIVTNLAMTYIHIPVDFDNPTVDNLKTFINLLFSLTNANKKVWVHCAKNYRVSAFMYVYHKHILNTPFEKVNLSMFDEWTPSETWRDLMKVDFKTIQN